MDNIKDIRNFKLLEELTGALIAEVDVEYVVQKKWLWKKEKTEIIVKKVYRNSIFWKFLDTGEFTPDRFNVSALYEVWKYRGYK